VSELSGVQSVASENEAGVFALSADTLALLSFALGFVEDYENWKDYPDEVLSDADIDDIDRLVGVATYEVMNMAHPTPIGSVVMWFSETIPDGWIKMGRISVRPPTLNYSTFLDTPTVVVLIFFHFQPWTGFRPTEPVRT